MPRSLTHIGTILLTFLGGQSCWSMMSVFWGPEMPPKDAFSLSIQPFFDETTEDSAIPETAFWGHLHPQTFSAMFPSLPTQKPQDSEQKGYLCLYHEIKKQMIPADKKRPPFALCQHVVQVKPHAVGELGTLYLPPVLLDFFLKGEKLHNPFFTTSLTPPIPAKISVMPALHADFPPLTPFLSLHITASPLENHGLDSTGQHTLTHISAELAACIRRKFMGLVVSTQNAKETVWVLSPQESDSSTWYHIQIAYVHPFSAIVTPQTRFLTQPPILVDAQLPPLTSRAIILLQNLKSTFKNNMAEADLDLYSIAERTPHFTADELKNLCQKALDEASSNPLSPSHFESAFKTTPVRYGAQDLSPFLPIEDVEINSQTLLIEQISNETAVSRPQTQTIIITGEQGTGKKTILAKVLEHLRPHIPYQRVIPRCVTPDAPQILSTILEDLEHVNSAVIAFPDFDGFMRHLKLAPNNETLSSLYQLLTYTHARKYILLLMTLSPDSLEDLKRQFGSEAFRSPTPMPSFSRDDQMDILKHYGVFDAFLNAHFTKRPETLQDFLNWGARHRVIEPNCF